jgi:hypothetical protein
MRPSILESRLSHAFPRRSHSDGAIDQGEEIVDGQAMLYASLPGAFEAMAAPI